MKKPLLLIAVLALTACAKTIEIEGGSSDSSKEITLSIVANPTKAIAEGTRVPEDNVIGLFPNFKSDVTGQDFRDYNKIRTFGYDYLRDCWRGLGDYEQEYPFTKSIMDDIRKASYSFSPIYWPNGERVYLDYTAYSTSNIVDLAFQLIARYSLTSMTNDKIRDVVDEVLAVVPYAYNDNRMHVYYKNNVVNYLSEAMLASFEGPVLSPVVVGLVTAMCIVADVQTGFEPQSGEPIITLDDVDSVVKVVMDLLAEEDGGSAKQSELKPGKKTETGTPVRESVLETYERFKENIPEELQPVWNKVQGVVEFIKDYAIAAAILSETYTEYERAEALAEFEMSEERFQEVVNKAYELFITRLPEVSKFIQDDLLLSHDTNVRNTGKGSIKATFNHSKAWVKVIVNNMTDKDIFVGAVAFDNVKTGGTLVIDNSKSEFETYWDFDMSRPILPEKEEEGERLAGLEFESYSSMTLEGESGSLAPIHNPTLMQAYAEKAEMQKKEKKEPSQDMVENIGLIPDAFYVPAHCYGPALSMNMVSAGIVPHVDPAPVQPTYPDIPYTPLLGDNEEEVEVDTAAVVPVGPGDDPIVADQPHFWLELTCLNGENPLSEENVNKLARKVGGAMFPSQEPGKIALLYYLLPKEKQELGVSPNDDGTVPVRREVSSMVTYLKGNMTEEDRQTVTLNLPRVKWEMGNVYIYVINISDNEITIEPKLTADWESQTVTEDGGTSASVPGGTEALEHSDFLQKLLK